MCRCLSWQVLPDKGLEFYRDGKELSLTDVAPSAGLRCKTDTLCKILLLVFARLLMKVVTIYFSLSATRNQFGLGVLHACDITRALDDRSSELSWASCHLKGKYVPVLLLKLAWSAHIHHVWKATTELQLGQSLASEEKLCNTSSTTVQ